MDVGVYAYWHENRKTCREKIKVIFATFLYFQAKNRQQIF